MPKERPLADQALQKIAGYLSRRSHSEEELRLKLSKKFSLNAAESAIQRARQKRWLENPTDLAEKTAESLHAKGKSWAYIAEYLKGKALPLPSYSRERELAKARGLLSKKRGNLDSLLFEEKAKLRRFLAYRGFEESVICELLDGQRRALE